MDALEGAWYAAGQDRVERTLRALPASAGAQGLSERLAEGSPQRRWELLA